MKIQIILMTALFCMLASAQDRHTGVNTRGDHVMGFSHETTTHHFRLNTTGGLIEVATNDPGDRATRDQIRNHLTHIAQMFANGNFDAPMLIHDRTPPGVPELQARKNEVAYRFEKTDRGGLVRITANSEPAVQAVHEFLRFQINDHQTGDPLTLSAPRSK